jgi:hypothetical protein
MSAPYAHPDGRRMSQMAMPEAIVPSAGGSGEPRHRHHLAGEQDRRPRVGRPEAKGAVRLEPYGAIASDEHRQRRRARATRSRAAASRQIQKRGLSLLPCAQRGSELSRHAISTRIECEHLFVSIKGSSYSRFRQSLATGRLSVVLLAAAELPQLALEDALEVLVLMAREHDQRFDRAAARGWGRLLAERPFGTRGRPLRDRPGRAAARRSRDTAGIRATAMSVRRTPIDAGLI